MLCADRSVVCVATFIRIQSRESEMTRKRERCEGKKSKQQYVPGEFK